LNRRGADEIDSDKRPGRGREPFGKLPGSPQQEDDRKGVNGDGNGQ
jgi:hypothetical protein